VRHGTTAMYYRGRCRCENCKRSEHARARTRTDIVSSALNALPEEDRKEALARLESWRDMVKANPLLGYSPTRSRSSSTQAARTKVRGFVGGNQSGKTTAGGFDSRSTRSPEELVPPGWRSSTSAWDGSSTPASSWWTLSRRSRA
jgi:hypothetical protein